MNSSAYDVIVVGGGTIGLSAAYHCARAGKKVLDLVPGRENIALFTGGTGQAFKYTPLLGKILSQLVLAGKTEYNIADFSIHRPGILT